MPLKAQCSICLSEIKPEDTVSAPECGHTAHRDCLAQWLQTQRQPVCHMCRARVTGVNRVHIPFAFFRGQEEQQVEQLTEENINLMVLLLRSRATERKLKKKLKAKKKRVKNLKKDLKNYRKGKGATLTINRHKRCTWREKGSTILRKTKHDGTRKKKTNRQTRSSTDSSPDRSRKHDRR